MIKSRHSVALFDGLSGCPSIMNICTDTCTRQGAFGRGHVWIIVLIAITQGSCKLVRRTYDSNTYTGPHDNTLKSRRSS